MVMNVLIVNGLGALWLAIVAPLGFRLLADLRFSLRTLQMIVQTWTAR